MYPPPAPPHYQEVTHLLHLFLCFVTFGFWLPVWIIMAIVVSNQNANARHQYERQLAAWTYEQRRWEIAREHWQAQQIGYAVRQQFNHPRNPRELY